MVIVKRKSDDNLIFLYSENSRIKLKQLSAILKKSSQRLKYSLSTLENAGILSNTNCVFDYSFFGLLLFRIYFKGGYISEKDKERIINTLKGNPYVVSVYELSGEFDLVIDIEAPNPSRFNKELKKISDEIPSLNNYKIVLNVVTHLYPRAYLIKNDSLLDHVPQHIILGGDRIPEIFKENEMQIIKNLLISPKMRFTNLAKNSGINIKTALSTFKTLKKNQIIRGFKSVIDANQLNIYKHRIFLNLHNLGQERESQLMEYFLKSKNIAQVNKTVGDWEMEIDIESLDSNHSRFMITQLREEFKDIIESFNIIEIYQYYKKSYLPLYLFKKSDEKDV